MFVNNNVLTEEQREKVYEININIDTLIGFMIEGNLAAPSTKRIIPVIYEILSEGESDPYTLNVFGNDLHREGCMEFTVFAPHTKEDTPEVKMIPQFERFLNTGIEFKKNNNNLLFARGFINFILSFPNLNKVRITGVLSEFCVKLFAIALKNLFNEYDLDIEVSVIENAIDTYNAPGHDADSVNEESIREMHNNGIKVLRRERGKYIERNKYYENI